MKVTEKLVDVTAVAQESGWPIDHSEPRITSWLESRSASADFTSVPVYFTRSLWERLGGSGPDRAAYHKRAIALLKVAREALSTRIVAQNAWRACFEAEWDAERHLLWLIINHRYSDGIAIGFGPGDFW